MGGILFNATIFVCILIVASSSSSNLLDRWYDFLSNELSEARMRSFESYVTYKDGDFSMPDAVNGLYVSEQDASYFADVAPCDFECVFDSFDGFHNQEERIRQSWNSGTTKEEKERITEFFKNVHGTTDWESVVQFAISKDCSMEACMPSLMPQFYNEEEFYGQNDTTIHTDLLEKVKFFGDDNFVSFHERSKELECDFYCVATLIFELEPVKPISAEYLPKPCFLENYPDGLANAVSCQDVGAFRAYLADLGFDWAENEHRVFNATVLPALGYDPSTWAFFPTWLDYLTQQSWSGCDFACMAAEVQRNLENALFHEALDEEAERQTTDWLEYLSTDMALTEEQIDFVFRELSFHWGRDGWFELVRDAVQTQCDFECMVNMYDIKTILAPEATHEEMAEWLEFLYDDMALDEEWGFTDWGHFLKSSRAHECDFECMVGHMGGLIDSFDYEPEPISVFVLNDLGELVHSWDYYLDDETKELVWDLHKPIGGESWQDVLDMAVEYQCDFECLMVNLPFMIEAAENEPSDGEDLGVADYYYSTYVEQNFIYDYDGSCLDVFYYYEELRQSSTYEQDLAECYEEGAVTWLMQMFYQYPMEGVNGDHSYYLDDEGAHYGNPSEHFDGSLGTSYVDYKGDHSYHTDPGLTKSTDDDEKGGIEADKSGAVDVQVPGELLSLVALLVLFQPI